MRPRKQVRAQGYRQLFLAPGRSSNPLPQVWGGHRARNQSWLIGRWRDPNDRGAIHRGVRPGQRSPVAACHRSLVTLGVGLGRIRVTLLLPAAAPFVFLATATGTRCIASYFGWHTHRLRRHEGLVLHRGLTPRERPPTGIGAVLSVVPLGGHRSQTADTRAQTLWGWRDPAR